MAWLPAFKFVKGLLAQEGQFLLPSGQPYIGSYHKLYNGETYTGSVPSKNSVQIFEDDSEPHLPQNNYEDKLVSENAHPDPNDYERGFFNRYFIKDTRGGKIIEVKKSTFDEKSKEKYLLSTTLKWILQKPVKDIFNQGFLFKGAATRNKENTQKASLEMPGIEKFITKYDKFVNIKSDVKGYKFEELPREEKLRIIINQSPLRTPPKLDYPHMMYDPKTGEGILVKTPKDHELYVEAGWVHEKPRFAKPIRGPRPLLRKKPPIPRSRPQVGSSGGGGGGIDYNVDEGFEGPQENIPGGGGGGSPAPQTNLSQGYGY